MKHIFYAIATTISHSNDLLIFFCLTLPKQKCLKCIWKIHSDILTMKQSILQTIDYVRNVKKEDSPSLIF